MISELLCYPGLTNRLFRASLTHLTVIAATMTDTTMDAAAEWEPVFLLAGQSNMAGRCKAEDLPPARRDDSGGVTFTLCWDNDSNFGEENGGHSNGEWRPLQCQESPGLGGGSFFGPEMGLAEALGPRLAELSIRRAHFLKFAMGSTNLHCHWNPENNNSQAQGSSPAKIGHYNRFIDFCRRALQDTAAGAASSADTPKKRKKLVGLFWLQGESDSAKAKTAKDYSRGFQALVTAIRSDLDVPSLPVVVSPVVWTGKYVDVVNQSLKNLGNGGFPNCVCVDEMDPCFGVQPAAAGLGAGHLTAEGALDIGRRMGEAFPTEAIILN